MNLIKCKLKENDDTLFMANKDVYINTENINAIVASTNQVVFTNSERISLSDNSINHLINIGTGKGDSMNIGF